MLPATRRRKIVELVSDRDGCSVVELAEEMDCSEATIRRDLNDLADRNMIERSHGGAVPATTVGQEQTHGQKQLQNLESKREIGKRAVTEIRDGQVVFFDSGSTTMQVVKQVPNGQSFIGVTNSPVLALELDSENIEVKVTGGSLRRPTRALIGPSAEQFIEGRTFDLLFLGTNAIDTAEGLMTPNEDEARLKKLMIENAQKVVLTADCTKLDEQSFVQFASLEEIDLFITDGTLDHDDRDVFENADVDVIDGLLQ